MSSSFDVFSNYTSDSFDKKLKQIRQEILRERTKGLALDSEELRSEGRMTHVVTRFDDERLKFTTTIQSDKTSADFELADYPDGDKMKLFLMMDHLGTTITDISGFGHHGYLQGHPTMHRAPFTMGFQQNLSDPGTPAIQFNTALDAVGNPTGEYIIVPDHADLQLASLANGFSVAFRFYAVDYSHDVGVIKDDDDVIIEEFSMNRRFLSKLDDANNAVQIVFDPTGDIDFQVTDGGTLYKRDFDALNLNQWYFTVMTYDPNAGATSTDRIKIYVNGTEGSSASELSLLLPPTSETDMHIGARWEANGFFRGYIHSFQVFHKVLNQTEVTNLNTNRFSSLNTALGKIAIVNYFTVDPA